MGKRAWLFAIHFQGHVAPLCSISKELQALGYECVVVSNDLAKARVLPLLPANVQFLSTGPNYCTEEEDIEVMQQFFRPGGSPIAQVRTFADKFCSMESNMAAGLWRLLGSGSTEPKPDVIVCDAMSMAGLDAAEHFGIPAVGVFQAPLSGVLEFMGQNQYNLVAGVPVEQLQVVFSERMTWLQSWVLNPILKRIVTLPMSTWGTPRRDAVRAELGLPRLANRTLFAAPSLPKFMMLVGTVWELERRRPLPPNWHVSGPLLNDFTQPAPQLEDAECLKWCQDAVSSGVPVVLIANGSLVRPQRDQVQQFAAALAQLPGVRFLWSLPKECEDFLVGHELGNVLRKAWIPQLAVLNHPACKLFVSHCGMNSVLEGVAAGVPIIGTPCGADQFILAQHLVDRGLGLQVMVAVALAQGLWSDAWLEVRGMGRCGLCVAFKVTPHTYKAAEIVSVMRQALASPAMVAACHEAAELLRRESGPANAARLIDGFLREGAAKDEWSAPACGSCDKAAQFNPSLGGIAIEACM